MGEGDASAERPMVPSPKNLSAASTSDDSTLALALRLLDELCQDLLEVPLDHVDGLIASGVLDEYDVSQKFWHLREVLKANL